MSCASCGLQRHGSACEEPWPRLDFWRAHLWHSWELFEKDVLAAHEGGWGRFEKAWWGSLNVHQTSGGPQKTQVRSAHVQSACCLVLAIVALLLVTYWLQGVLLPVLIAAGIAVLLEPLIYLLIDPVARLTTPRQRRPGIRGILNQADGQLHVELCPAGGPQRPSLGSSARAACAETEQLLFSFVRRMYCVMVVSVVIICVISLMCSLGAWIGASIQAVNWRKYLDGERVASFRSEVAKYGVTDFDGVMSSASRFLIQAAGVQVIGSTVSALSSFLLMVLFLGFFLIDGAAERALGSEPWKVKQRRLMAQILTLAGDGSTALRVEDSTLSLAATVMDQMREQMRKFIMAKFYLSLCKAVLIGSVFAFMQVDLWLLWTMLTFVLNFVPLGSSISTMAPVPIVLLDPSQTLFAAALSLLWPLMVHNFVGNVVEPKVFANSLSLHPVTVLLALTFWTAMWGVLGALVCVPLTAMLRIFLKGFQAHPYAAPVLRLVEGRS